MGFLYGLRDERYSRGVDYDLPHQPTYLDLQLAIAPSSEEGFDGLISSRLSGEESCILRTAISK